VRHLSRGHGIKPDSPGRRLDWTMKRCEFRLVPKDEITALTENSGAYNGPPKVPFKQTTNTAASTPIGPTAAAVNGNGDIDNHDGVASDYESSVPTKRRLSKVIKDVTTEDEEEESDVDMDDGDADFSPGGDDKEASAKKARHSVPFSPKQTLRQAKKAKG
jgi:hypothetical protein